MNWKSFREPRDFPYDPARAPWQRDFDRIVFSSAYRRLQDKTQVFPLSDSDYVRTRLTHTQEVATVARTLGTRVGYEVLKKHGHEPYSDSTLKEMLCPADFGAVVAAAALAHDIGNPPFGHCGESAIQHWIKTSPALAAARKEIGPEKWKDFEDWEGNAQGFRILTKLQMYKDEGGMRLSYATLGAFLKYPNAACVARPGDKKARPASLKKHGYFHSEIEAVREVTSASGLVPHADKAWKRHPLVFLMEAADDLCYAVVDFEDGYRLNRVSYRDAVDLLIPLAEPDPAKRAGELAKMERDADNASRIGHLRAKAIFHIINQVTEAFIKNEAILLSGEFDRDLVSIIPLAKELQALKDYCKKYIYSDSRVLETEAAGYEILPGLLEIFWEAVEETHHKTGNARAQKRIELIPEQFVGPGRIPSTDTYTRLLGVTDFVSGMTDTYALSLFRKLKGIALPA